MHSQKNNLISLKDKNTAAAYRSVMVVSRKIFCGIDLESQTSCFFHETPFLFERMTDGPVEILVDIFSKMKEGNLSPEGKN